MLKMMRNKFKGELAGILADLTNIPSPFINFLIEKVGEDTNDPIKFIDKITEQFKEFDNEESTGEQQGDPNVPPPDKGEGQNKASKTQGTLPGAPEANPAERTATDTATLCVCFWPPVTTGLL
jgi:hypothetical protein